MKKIIILFAAAALSASAAFADEAAPGNKFKFYGFIRNYFAFDTHESKSGTGDLFYYLPLDRQMVGNTDTNERSQFRFLAMTSRVGVDVSGYHIGNADFGAKVEADFYCFDSNGKTAILRLRQAFLTIKDTFDEGKYSIFLKAGQAWHPLAADLPDIFSLESGAPFNPFSRTPQLTFNFGFGDHFTIDWSLIWQMQYLSTGPSGATANYMKYSVIPENYIGLTYKNGGFLARAAVDILSITPRYGYNGSDKIKDRITTFSPFIYLQYTKGDLRLKAKTIYAEAGEHVNIMSGYAVTSKADPNKFEYAPLHSSSSWVTASYGKKFCGAILLGYMKNFGTDKEITGPADLYFNSNVAGKNLNRMFRLQPEVTYNLGKFTFGLEYQLTGAQYGKKESMNAYALCNEDLHWVLNHRIQAMLKFTF